jgi:hypothetical protein
MIRRFPSRRHLRAVEIGADELMARVEWEFRQRPHALRNVRTQYRRFCVSLLARLERRSKAQPQRAAA